MEDFGYVREEKSSFFELLRKVFLVAATLFSITCFIYVTITAYDFVYNDQNGEIETIKSPENKIKVTQENRIETDLAHEGASSIYDDIFGNHKESLAKDMPKIHLAPEPAFPPKKEIVMVVESDEEDNKKNEEANKPTTYTTNNKIVVYTNQKKEEQGTKDLLTKGTVELQHHEAKKTSNRGLIKVQIAALTSKNSVDEYWKKLNHLNPRLFSGLKLFTQTVDLGKRGIFYRVQIGNFANQIEAEDFCNSYVSQTQKSKADCIMVE